MNKLNILNKFFSRTTLRHWIDNQYDPTYAQVIKRYAVNGGNKNNYEIISEIYKELKNNYRNEYYYKNTLLNKLLLGIHSINTTTALTEIPIAKSKADFVLINGKAIVYEIKTELDNFDRLESQISDYYKAFDHVVVVTCKENFSGLLNKIREIEKPVGIYILQKNGTLSPIYNPKEYRESLDGEILFKLLRKSEYEEILLKHYSYLPSVSEFKYYSECKKLFLKLPLEGTYPDVLMQLKRRTKIIKEEFVKVPYELKFLAYFMDLNKDAYTKLSKFLNEGYGGV